MDRLVLVTGGAGFIGSHVVERLVEKDHRVVCLDNFDSYYPAAIKRENLSDPLSSGRVTLIEGDIRDREALVRIMAREGVQAVVHLAGRAGVRPSLEDPETYLDVNVGGTLRLLAACQDFGVPRFIFSSSSSVYGQVEGFTREEGTACRPLSPYGASKVAAEALCSAYAQATGLTAIALRLFTVFGPRQRPDMAISSFTRRIVDGEDVPVYGEGRSLRDYTFITDIVDGIEAALEAPVQGFHVFNLGRGQPIALLDMIGLIEQELGESARLRFLPEQRGDPPFTCADIAKAKAVLGYQPKVSFEEGIAHYVRWFREKRCGPSGD